MSEPGTPRRWQLADLLLAQAVAAVVLMTLAVAIWGARALPWTTQAEGYGRDMHAATGAAEEAVRAFLGLDYRRIDADSREVIDLSTSPFREQFAYGSTDLRVATMRVKSVSTAKIRAVGLKSLDGTKATLLVGADTVLRTTATKTQKATKSCPHARATCGRYRFLVTMTRVDDRWLLSNLAEVP